jgi:hypothetical protein
MKTVAYFHLTIEQKYKARKSIIEIKLAFYCCKTIETLNKKA